ncbi:MAG: 23S rRNA (pseudouridine(1915)-N(3))-methyltransferase RlmH [Akkermansiaceae bacterium]|jgi:23S rRNA (pseudouridine1915-N3)-methyltransferase|nr:23S rRNA (pseudouridine(1915)-N(3))-methyltransferase RlmH [Akkermansiaceae bacterium]
MKIRIIVAGKPALPFARAGVGEYLKRLGRFGAYEWETVRAGNAAEVSARLLERSAGCFRVALDERGETPDTRQLADRMADWERRGTIKTVAFLIGAADGHSEPLRRQCDWLLALSNLTLQHELAALLLLEQLYRVATLRAGLPYHRD